MKGIWVLAGFAACLAAPAAAQESYGVVGCGSNSTTPEVLIDGALYLARNEIGPITQDVGSAALSYSRCDGERNGRWRFEGNLSVVSDDFGDTQSLLVGAGYQFALGPMASITPIVRIGYAAFDNRDDEVAAGAGLIFSHSSYLGDDRSSRATWLTFEAAPEYTSWQSADIAAQGLSFDDGVFSSFAAAGVSFPVGDLRGRVRLGHRYIDSDGPVSSISSVILSLGRDPIDREGCQGRCWNVDLWISDGDGDYSSVLIGLSRPFGR